MDGVDHRQTDVRQTYGFGGLASTNSLGGVPGLLLLGEPLTRVVAQRHVCVVEHGGTRTKRFPDLRVDTEVSSTQGWIDGRQGNPLGPAERLASEESFHNRLRQCDMAAHRRVHRVIEKVVVQKAVLADFVEQFLAVNQDAIVPTSHDAVGVLKR